MTPSRLAGVEPRLYAITDRALSGLSHEEQVVALLAGGARIIQLRDKERPLAELVPVARRCRELTREAGALLIINDHVELAAMVGADGVHLGQDDADPALARQQLGADFLIGVSTHTRAQFEAAMLEPVDYIALGPVFGTSTKADASPATGLELVRIAASLLGEDARALVLIGGITSGNVAEALGAAKPGRAFAAVISALLAEGDIAGATQAMIGAMRA